MSGQRNSYISDQPKHDTTATNVYLTNVSPSNNINIHQVIRLHAWLDQHPDTNPAPLASSSAPLSELSDTALVMSWWDQSGIDSGEETFNLMAFSARLLAIGVGLLLGITVTTVALSYSGAHPVNLLVLLGIFVLLPLGSLLLSLIILLNPGTGTATTAFYHHERCLWHANPGLFSLFLPVGGPVQPPAGAGLADFRMVDGSGRRGGRSWSSTQISSPSG